MSDRKSKEATVPICIESLLCAWTVNRCIFHNVLIKGIHLDAL